MHYSYLFLICITRYFPVLPIRYKVNVNLKQFLRQHHNMNYQMKVLMIEFFILASFPNETVTLVVRAILEDGPPIIASSSSLLPVFRCEFVEESDSSYVYDVYWYINGDEVVVHRNVYFSNISFTNLRGSQWLHKHHMNMEVYILQGLNITE